MYGTGNGKMIEVTFADGKKGYLRASAIVAVVKSLGMTDVFVPGHQAFLVTESVEDVVAMATGTREEEG